MVLSATAVVATTSAEYRLLCEGRRPRLAITPMPTFSMVRPAASALDAFQSTRSQPYAQTATINTAITDGMVMDGRRRDLPVTKPCDGNSPV
jgi:hypothetical protein